MPPPMHRQLAVSLALCAMVLRALLPDGWMPNTGMAAAAAPFIICSVDGTHSGGKAPAAPAPDRSHAPCAFAAAAPLAPPMLARDVAAPRTQMDCPTPQVFTVFAAATVHRPNAARAPPVFI